ncbi:hypothetical protein GCM10009665_33630 [Kitasatospora nipponensis]|uniref:Uncharacterized protein n=1 Tax=Kitasatospora nipponensis TaxID=258049 RepID=A0ABP4GVG9_9ACTN
MRARLARAPGGVPDWSTRDGPDRRRAGPGRGVFVEGLRAVVVGCRPLTHAPVAYSAMAVR